MTPVGLAGTAVVIMAPTLDRTTDSAPEPHLPTGNIALMTSQFALTEDQQAVRAAVRELAEKEIAPYAAECDEQERYPVEAQKALTAAGFHAVHIPEEFGGFGADALSTVLVIEEVARVCASSSLIPAVNKLGSMPILLSGSAELKQRVLPSIASGEAMISYALSEREAGSDAGAMRTRAVPDGDDWVLTGTKCWITNAGVSSWYTVMAVTEPGIGARGISAFVVHADDDGFQVGSKERKLGIKGSPTREIHFDRCRVPGWRMIGDPGTGFKTALATLDHTRPTIGAQAVGIAQGALDLAVGYLKERRQFGKKLADFQGLQFMAADMAMAVEASRTLVYQAAVATEAGAVNATFLASAAKCLASDTAMQVTTDAVQLLGGAGYTRDFPAERMMRDAKITQIYEGTNQIQRMVMARSLFK
jgi:alkylation response protein AidB-like acyl-CoA dehydrogenase